MAHGLRSLPAGRHRRCLEDRFEHILSVGFEGRVLPFDTGAADRYGSLMSHRRSTGRPMSILDAQIAAIAGANGFAVATRNTRDFEDCGLDLLDPFESAAGD